MTYKIDSFRYLRMKYNPTLWERLMNKIEKWVRARL